MIRFSQTEGPLAFWTLVSDEASPLKLKKGVASRSVMASFCQKASTLSEVGAFLAFHYALKLLSKKAYHSHKLSVKLTQAGFPRESVGQTIERLIQKGYLDDRAYQERRVEALKKRGKSGQEIRFLMKKEGVKGSASHTDDAEALRICLKKKYPKWREFLNDKKQREKLLRALHRRGFSSEILHAVCPEILDNGCREWKEEL